MMMAKDLVAGMSIYDPTPGGFDNPVVLVISTRYEMTTKLQQGPAGALLMEEEKLELLLMDDPEKWQCHVCRINPGSIVTLAAPKFVMPPPARKAEE